MTTIHLSRDAPVVLIDASYFSIYRLFATSRWWTIRKRRSKTNSVSDFAWNEKGFREAVLKHTQSDIQKIQKKFGLIGRANKAIAPNNIILCKDCSPATIWRLDVYSDYKKRYRNGKKNHLSGIPRLGIQNMPNHPFNTYVAIGHPQLEADDVACLLFRQIRGSYNQPSVSYRAFYFFL